MATFWMNSKKGGTCANPACGKPYDVGFRIFMDAAERDGKKFYKQLKCEACPDDKGERRDQRREQEAVMRSSLPQTTAELVERCGTLSEAVSLLQGSAEMATALKAVGRSPNELFLAAANACMKSRDLPRADPASWLDSLMAAAALGIIPDPGMGPAALAYFIPRGGKVSLDLSYRGLALIAHNTGSLREVQAEVIWECEVVLGELVSLLRSADPYLKAAGEALKQKWLTDPKSFELSAWDESVVARAINHPTGLAVQWFRYQEAPLRLEHRRPGWFQPPEWTENAPLPWGVYADIAMQKGGRAVTVLTRDVAYQRATRGGNVRVERRSESEPLRLVPGTNYGKWATTPWCRDQMEMLKKTALRDVLTGGKVPVTPRMQMALRAEVLEGEYTEVPMATSLDQHLRQIAGGAPIADEPRQIEQHEYVEDDVTPSDDHELVEAAAPVEGPAARRRAPKAPGLFGQTLEERLHALPEGDYAAVYAAANIPVGVATEDLSPTEKARLEKALNARG